MYNYNLDDLTIPNHTVIVELMPKEQVTEENGLYLLSQTIRVPLDNGQFVHVPDPNVFLPYGKVIKVGVESNIKVGSIVYLADEVPAVRLNIDDQNPYPHYMPYGFWLNPQMKYKVQTNMVHVPETLINAWTN